MRRRHTTSQRPRAFPLLGRPVPQSLVRREVLDDALLGADWRWDDERPTSAS